jgi:hypothetical protein
MSDEKGVSKDSELGRAMGSADLANLTREESRQRLALGTDQGAKRRQLEEQSGDRFEDLRDKPKGF